MSGHITLILAVLLGIGFLVAKLGQRLRLPSVTGYIAAGVLLGPVGLNLVNASVLQGRLEHFTELALMLVAFGIGEHLEIRRLKPMLRKVQLIGMGETLGAYLMTAGGCLAAAWWTDPGQGQWTWMNYFILAILLGAVCVATAPAATLHIVRELQASGPMTATLMAVVAVNNGLAIISFGITVSIARQLGGGVGQMGGAVVAAAAEICGSLILGAVTGWIMDLTVHRLKKESEMLTLGLALLLLCGESARVLHLSSLLAGMAAGMVIVNRDRRDVRVFRTINAFEPPIYVLFFTLAGSHLEPRALMASGWVGLAYFIMRTTGKLIGAGAGARISGSPPAIANNIGLALLPQAGVAIGLIFLIQGDSTLSVYASVVTPVVLAGVVLSELIGPACTRMAVTRAGETADGRQRGKVTTGDGNRIDRINPEPENTWQGHWFPTPAAPSGVVLFGVGHPASLPVLCRLAVLLAYHHKAQPLAVRVVAHGDAIENSHAQTKALNLLSVAHKEAGCLGSRLKALSIEAAGVSDGLLAVAAQHPPHALLLGCPKEKSPQQFQQILEKVARNAACPVIIAHMSRLERPSRILVAVTAAKELHILAPVVNALALLRPHTVSLLWLLPHGISDEEVELHTDIMRAWADRNAIGPAADFRAVETHARLETILATAADQDLIIMATRAGGSLSRLIWGSLAEEVARQSDKPMLVVHHRGPVTSVYPPGKPHS